MAAAADSVAPSRPDSTVPPPVPGRGDTLAPPAAHQGGDSLAAPPSDAVLWVREGGALERYAIRTWGDLFAALPGSRADRFGPPGYFETVRVGGTGRPIVLFEGVALPASAGGAPNVNSVPRGTVTGVTLSSTALFPRLALAAPDGALELTPRPWEGGLPRSFMEALRGADNYTHYVFGFQRDLWRKLWFQFNVNFRRADSYVLESFDRKEIYFRGGLPVGGGYSVEAGRWSNENKEILLDPDLGVLGGFTHRGEEKSELAFFRVRTPGGWIGQWYDTRLQSSAAALIDTVSGFAADDDRSGALVAGEWGHRSLSFDFAARSERREAEADGRRRVSGETSLSAGVAVPIRSDLRCRAAVVQEIVHDGDAVTGGSASIAWERPAVASSVRLVRARRRPTARQWAYGFDSDGVVHYGEAALRFPAAPGRPLIRCFRREVDHALFLYATDAYFEQGAVIDERSAGVEVAVSGGWRSIEGELSWMLDRARDKGSSERLPYQSDHVVRARGSWGKMVPYIEADGRIDLLGEWRSDRTAPGRAEPMDDYYYLRARGTLDVNGAHLFGQLEQMLGNQLEYIDAAPPGGEGALSGTVLVYFGITWPLED